MSISSITKAPGCTLNYIQNSRPYQGLKAAGSYCKEAVQKVYNTVIPRNPVTGHREIRFIPASVENLLGIIHYNDLCPKSKVSTDAKLNARIAEIFNKLVAKCDRPGFKYEVRVMEDDAVVNAFCLPGGKIAITTGLINKLRKELKIEKAEDQLHDVTLDDKIAAVLGHEIAHACAGHGARSMQLKLFLNVAVKVASFAVETLICKKGNEKIEENATEQEKIEKKKKLEDQAKAASSAVNLLGSFSSHLFSQYHSQCHELESDRYGMQLAHRAGYNIKGAIWLQGKFLELHGETEGQKRGLLNKATSLFASHPPSEDRLNANRRTAQEIRSGKLY